MPYDQITFLLKKQQQKRFVIFIVEVVMLWCLFASTFPPYIKLFHQEKLTN